MQSDPKVLIIGAGPTGMVLASELRRRGVSCRIVERRAAPSHTSRSFTLHARTMLMFQDMGIAHRYLSDGIKSGGFVFHFKGLREEPLLDFTKLPGRYPYILVYNQDATESVLRNHLESTYDQHIEWGTELTELSVEDGRPRALLTPTAGDSADSEEVRPQFVVGADGIHSTVRESLDLEYDGANYDGMVMQMMDVALQEPFPDGDDWVHYYIEKNNFLLVTKLPGDTYRVLISDRGETSSSGLSARESFQKLVDGHLSGVTLEEPAWDTKWEIWKRLAKTFRQGSVFLAGDAAHVHSPAGGQGMNAGMQDAYNLAWKLALVARGEASETLLDSYETERQPIAEQVIQGTDDMTNIIMWHGQGVEERMALTREPSWNEKATLRISGLSYTYRDPDTDEKSGPAVGDLAPDVELADGHWLSDLISHPRFTLLGIAGPGRDDAQQLAAILSETSARYQTTVKPLLICRYVNSVETRIPVASDPDGRLSDRYASGPQGQLNLIRPDGYIAVRSAADDLGALDRYLTETLTP
jgi:2-polyprenyl-6-methoxyphenol hydroxylase-like FAD-dependent oxidoreductase